MPLHAQMVDQRADVALLHAALALAHSHDALLRQEARQRLGQRPGRCVIRQGQLIICRAYHRHQRGMLVLHGLGKGQLHVRRQGGVHGGHEGIRLHRGIEGHVQDLLLPHGSGGQGGGKGQQNMRVEPLRVAHRQPGAAQRPLHGPLNIQMSDVAQPCALLKYSHHPQNLHTPLNRCRPQPLQPLRQSFVVSARSAFCFSRQRYSLVTPLSMKSQGRISSFSRRR